MKNKILVYGCFGYFNNQLDGQTIKTRDIYGLLKSKFPNQVYYLDSLEMRKNIFLIFRLFYYLCKCKNLLFIGADNNLKYIFPIIFLISKILRFNIIYIGVGGWLDNILAKLPIQRWMLKHINGILVENLKIVDNLRNQYQITKIEKIPNFRQKSELYIRKPDEHLKLVYMARIQKKKGLDSIVKLAEHIDESYPKNSITIDFYGQINPKAHDYFMENLVNRFNFVRYNGHLIPEKIVSTLNHYDVLILPTHYYTEGFPGSILDAYRASLPVIVTEWKHSHEFVINGKTGFIIPFNNCEPHLCDKVDFFYKNTHLLENFKKNSYKESLNYTPEKAWSILNKYMK